MPLIQDVFRQYAPLYLQKFGLNMPANHKKALNAIINCRSKNMGGQVYYCRQCSQFHYSYHSCQNRHCVVCGNNHAAEWIERQKIALLPFPYFLATFTLPHELRTLTRSRQKLFYNILFKASADSLKRLAKDPKFLGAHIGMIGVLHTWTRALVFHPHVHYLIPGGGIALNGSSVRFSDDHFLMHVKALSLIFKAKFRDELKKNNINVFQKISRKVWQKPWVVHIKPVGSGEKALEYLGRYLFRVAIANNRILKSENGKVTFRYTDSKSGENKTVTLKALEFIRRFLQHVLPQQFIKVRYFGFLAPAARKSLNQLRKMLFMEPIANKKDARPADVKEYKTLLCPLCKQPLVWVADIPKGFLENAP